MERLPRYPQLDEINGREWIDTLSHQAGKRITLGHPPPITQGKRLWQTQIIRIPLRAKIPAA